MLPGTLELAIFEPHLLTTNTAVEFALVELQAEINDVNFDSLIDNLVLQPLVLAFVLSATDKQSPITSRISMDFPATPKAFIGSVSAKVLSTLSLFLSSPPFALPSEDIHSLGDYWRIANFAPQVLEELLTFANNTSASYRNKDKQAERPGGHTLINTIPFYQLKYRIPDTFEDAEKMAADILRGQRRTLEFYLSFLRRRDVSELVKKAYLPSHVGVEDNIDEESVFIRASRSIEDEIMPAYQMIQPLKTALYFDNPKGFGEWEIYIESRADNDLRDAKRRDAQTFERILRKIKDLSKGNFSADNHKQLNGSKNDIPIYRARVTDDLRLVYQVDCIPEHGSALEKQAIKIFGFYTHAQLDDRFWDSMSYQLSRRGKEHIKRCKFRSQKAANDYFSPAYFPSKPDDFFSDPGSSSMMAKLSQEDLGEIHSLVGLGKYVSVSQPLLYSIFADLDVQHVFQVSRQEMDVVEHKSSCYVLGRSGTGKTTTMLFKMLCIERSWETSTTGRPPKPRQLFVTKSATLARKVKEYFSGLLESLRMASLSPEELKKVAKMMKGNANGEDLINKGDQETWERKLPACFSLLKDDHFPLFLSFDQLCELLWGDVATGNSSNECQAAQDTDPGSKPFQDKDTCSRHGGIFVSYQVFKKSYWPHFSKDLTKKLEPFLVFSELLGVIRGSEAAINEKGFMSREAYEGSRSQSAYATLRSAVYSIFELYLKQKRERGDYDAADRLYDLLKNGVRGGKVDYLYVDEAQDNLLIDSLLLRKLCRNANGMFWAGDTAQTVSAGSAFSFNELKAFLYRLEEMRRHNRLYIDSNMIRREEPRMFQLPVNYRSHAGIVDCAHSVIEIITRFWPNSIDVLAPEKGLVDGVKPVFFSGFQRDQDEAAIERFFLGANDNPIEFGAQQCIIVRDQAAVDRLKERGINGTIMTLYDSKGQEFNDVLLYNFFRDSKADFSQWRVILNSLGNLPAPSFDEIRHAVVCSELKFLYVAVTRARMNLWIVDFSESSEPMRTFWSARNLIQNCSPGMSIPHLAKASSREEWATQGGVFFDKEEYPRAMECFEKALMPDKVAVAKAYHHREEARTTASGSRLRLKVFIKAANAFLECAKSIPTAKREYLRTAAECYQNAGKHDRAAQLYMDVEAFDHAAQAYCDCGMFGNAIEIIDNHEQSMGRDVVDGVIHKARLFYFRENRRTEALELFSSCEEGLQFTIDEGLEDAQLDLLFYMRRFADIGEIYYKKGRLLEATEHFLMEAGRHPRQRAINCILRGLWQNISLWNDPELAGKNQDVSQLFKFATELDANLWSSNDRDELSMFHAIRDGDPNKLLRQLGDKFYHDHENPPAAIRCFDHVFNIQSHIHTAMTRQGFTAMFNTFFAYAGILKSMTLHVSPAKNVSIQKLFAFQPVKKDVYFVPRQTHLHDQLKKYQTSFIRSNDDGKWLSPTSLSVVIKDTLKVHVRGLIGSIMNELESAIVDAENWSISAALIFMRNIVRHQLPISATDICYFFDCVCGFLSFSMRGQFAFLPSDWHEKIRQAATKNLGRDTRLFPAFVAPIRELVENILDQDTDHIHFDSPHESDKDILISRLFRALFVLGTNSTNTFGWLRLEILAVTASLADILLHSPYIRSQQYAKLKSWKGVFYAVKTSGEMMTRMSEHTQHPGSTSEDAKITLAKGIETKPKPSSVTLNKQAVERVILKHLAPSGENTNRTHSLNPDSKVKEEGLVKADSIRDNSVVVMKQEVELQIRTLLAPSGGNVDTTHALNPDPQVEHDGSVEAAGNDVEEEVAQGDNAPLAGAVGNRPDQLSTAPTEREIRAAIVWQRAFRRKLSNRRVHSKISQLYVKCWSEVQNIPSPRYRRVFLGPLPHLLLCLDEIGKYALSAKAQVKRRKDAEGQELEELGRRQTELATIMNRVKRLQKSLGPKADIHRAGDVAALEGYLPEVEALVRQLPYETQSLLHVDFEIAVKGI